MSEFNNNENSSPVYQEKMPSKGLAVFWMVIGFLTGVLWGCLCISPMSRMNAAIKDNDSYEAYANYKKIRMFALIGIAVNIVLILIGLARGSGRRY